MAGATTGGLLLYDACAYGCHLECSLGDGDGGVSSLAPLARGFACGSTDGKIHVFGVLSGSTNENPEGQFIQLRAVQLGHAPISAVSPRPSEDELVAVSDDQQLWALALGETPGMAPKRPRDGARPLVAGFHGPGAITGLDVCVRKPLIASCGLDRSVRVWNYLDHSLELVKYFGEDPYARPSRASCPLVLALHLAFKRPAPATQRCKQRSYGRDRMSAPQVLDRAPPVGPPRGRRLRGQITAGEFAHGRLAGV